VALGQGLSLLPQASACSAASSLW